MAGVSRDRAMEFKGLLNDLQDWESSFKKKDQKLKGQSSADKPGSRGKAGKGPVVEVKNKSNVISEASTRSLDEQHKYLKYSDPISHMSSSFLDEERLPSAASEKELGNEYFKQKKFTEAIGCYSRSIALSPTSVAFANKAMAYLKLKRFEEAENDCTEALNLDDRYVKAYSRRATARKELGKLKASMEDSEFAMRLEPNNQELKKQYLETKALYDKEILGKISGPQKASVQGIQRVGNTELGSKDVLGDAQNSATSPHNYRTMDNSGKIHDRPLISVKETGHKSMTTAVEARETLIDGSSEDVGDSFNNGSTKKRQGVGGKHELKDSMQDLASRAAFRVMASAAKNIALPKSAYEFEVSWRALSDDPARQAELLMTIPPASLPQIFKNALSAPILVNIVRCIATFFKKDTGLAVSILDSLAKVPRFDMLVMCLSAMDHSELQRIWEEVFSSKEIPANQIETLSRLRPKYCYGGWQDHILGSNGWPKEL